MEALLHYSSVPLREFRDPGEPRGLYKPAGLWVSVGTAWAEWCEVEQYNRSGFSHVSEVVLRRDARILCMGSGEQLDEFTALYGKEGSHPLLLKEISWPRVAEDFQGIIISPYVWERRLELSWYYGWDCASGCIWDGDAIAEIISKEEATA